MTTKTEYMHRILSVTITEFELIFFQPEKHLSCQKSQYLRENEELSKTPASSSQKNGNVHVQ